MSRDADLYKRELSAKALGSEDAIREVIARMSVPFSERRPNAIGDVFRNWVARLKV